LIAAAKANAESRPFHWPAIHNRDRPGHKQVASHENRMRLVRGRAGRELGGEF
jgi:hypothetical protein